MSTSSILKSVSGFFSIYIYDGFVILERWKF